MWLLVQWLVETYSALHNSDLHKNQTELNPLWLLWLLLGGRQLSRWSFSVAQATCLYTLLKECCQMQPRPPSNVVWVTGSQMCPLCVFEVFTPVLRIVRLWSDHWESMLISGLSSPRDSASSHATWCNSLDKAEVLVYVFLFKATSVEN